MIIGINLNLRDNICTECIEILYPTTWNKNDAPVMEILNFCLPFEYQHLSLIMQHGVQYFTFVVTDVNSTFKYGFCRFSPNLHYIYCIISFFPYYDLFYHITNQIASCVEYLIDSGKPHSEVIVESQFISWLQILCLIPQKSSGDVFTIPNNPFNTVKVKSIGLDSNYLLPTIPEDKNLTACYGSLDASTLSIIFMGLIFERRIIFSSKKLSLLSSCIHAVSSIIYPLKWQHIFIPILPKFLIEYCNAPVPYIIGMHKSFQELVDTKIDTSEVITVDLDIHDIVYPKSFYDNDMKIFTNSLLNKLIKRLKRADLIQGDYIPASFLKIMVKLLANYRSCMYKEDNSIKFNHEKFIGNPPVELNRTLASTQSFLQFIENRIILWKSECPLNDVFEIYVDRYLEKKNLISNAVSIGIKRFEKLHVKQNTQKFGNAFLNATLRIRSSLISTSDTNNCDNDKKNIHNFHIDSLSNDKDTLSVNKDCYSVDKESIGGKDSGKDFLSFRSLNIRLSKKKVPK